MNNKIEKSEFDITPEGEKVHCYTLSRKGGLVAKILNFGGILTELHVPDSKGKYVDVVLGFNDVDTYLKENIYAGTIIGRIAGRVAKGELRIDDKTYWLAQNEGTTHLHGGIEGFDKKLWDAKIVTKDGDEALKLSYYSQDGEEGYPGNMDISVTYSLTEKDGIRIDFEAEMDCPTPICMTNHSYFNLGGEGVGDINAHIIQINSGSIVEVDQNFLPTGKVKKVIPGISDFRKPSKIESMLKSIDRFHGAMYVLDSVNDWGKAASIYEPKSGRTMNVYTNAPGMQLYTGLFLDTISAGKSGKGYKAFAGVCFECQGFPCAFDHKSLKTIALLPGKRFKQSTEYRFPINRELNQE